MIRVEGIALLRPVHQDLDKLAARKQWLKAKLDSLCDAVPGRTGGKFRGEIVEDQLAGRLDLHNLASAMELPRKGTAGYGVAVEQAFVLHKVARVLRSTVAGSFARTSCLKRSYIDSLKILE